MAIWSKDHGRSEEEKGTNVEGIKREEERAWATETSLKNTRIPAHISCTTL